MASLKLASAAFTILVLIIVVGEASAADQDGGCSEEAFVDVCSCPRVGVRLPVCAGGITYGSHCLYECAKKGAECSGEQGFPELENSLGCLVDGCSQAQIVRFCSCPRFGIPVCAGGIFFDTDCKYECEKKKAECRGEQGFPELDNDSDGCFAPEG